jgi:hypothetical protein
MQSFRELDDLVLHLKGLVLVRGVREERGADADELAMYGAEIDGCATASPHSSESRNRRRNGRR